MEQNKETNKPIQYKKKERKRELPKNVRQIGEIAGKQRIYVEDYVVTYLNQLAHPTNTVARGAILLGEWVHYDKEDVLFISGAIEADHLSFDMREVAFSDETWTGLYEKINQYFEEINVVGWFLSRLGYSIKLTDSMRKIHNQYFKGQGSVLYLMDALEQEDAFFLNKEGKLLQQSGYYIYYERNTPMQNYLIENQAIERNSGQDKRIDYKDGQLLHSYHEIMASRQGRKDERRVTSLLYVTSAMLVIVFLALSISIFNNYDKLKSVQESLNVIMGEETLVKTKKEDSDEAQPASLHLQNGLEGGDASGEAAEVSLQENAADVPSEDTALQEGTDPTDNMQAQDTSVANDTTQAPDTDVAAATTEPPSALTAQEAEGNNANAVEASGITANSYYIVQSGDTLLSISQKIYNSGAYVESIRLANEIGENDFIYPGQQIILPVVQ